MSRVVFFSDLHLSPKHGFFWRNFCHARDAANVTEAAAVVVCGDLCIDGPDSDAEMTFAALALAGLDAEMRVQFERHGYFVTDRLAHRPGVNAVFNRTVELKDSWQK